MIRTKGKRHPWHDIHYGDDAPDEIVAVIECPKGSTIKYELDKETGFMMLDRVLYSAVHYPGDYGFVPRTYYDDEDPLDIIILSNYPVAPGVMAKVRPIGVVEMIDEDEKDFKIIAVHSTDPRFDRYNNITDLSDAIVREIKHFFQTYKQLQNKKVEVLKISGLVEAKKEIKRAIKMYEEEFGFNPKKVLKNQLRAKSKIKNKSKMNDKSKINNKSNK